MQKIRDAIRTGTKLEVDLLNYRKVMPCPYHSDLSFFLPPFFFQDGTPFINGFCMFPLHEKGERNGKIGFFIAIQKNVTVIARRSTPGPQVAR